MKSTSLFITVLVVLNFCSMGAHAQWTQTGVALAYPVTAIQFIDGDIVAGTSTDHRVYLSTDAGAKWGSIDSALPTSSGSFSLAVGNGAIFAGNSYGIFVTTDFGSTWEEVDSTLRGPGGIGSVSLADNGSKLLAGLSGGLYESTDDGKTWTTTGLLGLRINAVTFTGSTILAASNDVLSYSTDGGVSWGSVDSMYISTFAVSGNNVFAGGPRGLYRSTDAGIKWTTIGGGLGLGIEGVTALAMSGEDVVVGTMGALYRSSDNGNSWEGIGSGLADTIVTALGALGPDVFAGTGAGMYRSTDSGSHWESAGLTVSAMSRAFVSSLAAIGTNIIAVNTSDLATDSSAGIYVSTNEGADWSTGPVLSGAGVLGFCGTQLFYAKYGAFNPLYSSTDGGNRWKPAGVNPPYYTYALASTDSDLYAGTSSGVYLSSDTGKTWTSVGLPSNTIVALAAGFGLVFAGVNISNQTTSYVYRTSNNGTTWSAAEIGIYPLVSLALIGDTLIAGTDGEGIAVSADSGRTWTRSGLNDGMGNSKIGGFVTEGANIFVGADAGVFLSKNAGSTWSNVSEGLPVGCQITSIAANGDYLFVGLAPGSGNSNGVWRRPLPEMITEVNGSANPVPETFSLSQNFPNPFNPTTVIQYGVRSSRLVSLKVYDVLGRLVKTLVNGVKSPGSYEVRFNGSQLASGVYFYRLAAGGHVIIRKMLLMK